MHAIPDFGAGFGCDGQRQKSGKREPRDAERPRRRRRF